VKHFSNTKNAIPNIQDIEIINAFYDVVTNIKTIEEITMKKPKIVAHLLAVVDECIETSEARAWLNDAWNKGSSKKSKRIRRSMLLTAGTGSYHPPIRRRGDRSIVHRTWSW
jgi:hypothetical protein